MADTYQHLLDTILKPWVNDTALEPQEIVSSRGAFEAAGRALAVVMAPGAPTEGTIYVVTPSATLSRDVRNYLAGFFADTPDLAALQAKRTADGFELSGVPNIVVDDNPLRRLPHLIATIELHQEATVTVRLGPLDVWRWANRVVADLAEDRPIKEGEREWLLGVLDFTYPGVLPEQRLAEVITEYLEQKLAEAATPARSYAIARDDPLPDASQFSDRRAAEQSRHIDEDGVERYSPAWEESNAQRKENSALMHARIEASKPEPRGKYRSRRRR